MVATGNYNLGKLKSLSQVLLRLRFMWRALDGCVTLPSKRPPAVKNLLRGSEIE